MLFRKFLMANYKKFGMLPVIVIFLTVVISTFVYVILPSVFNSATILRLGDGVFRTQVAVNAVDRDKGLSGVSSFASDQAFLMIFPSDGKWEVQTKDMRIPVDVVWLSSDKKVVYVVKNVQPNDPVITPKAFARYIVELPVDTISQKAIIINSTAIFQVNELVSD